MPNSQTAARGNALRCWRLAPYVNSPAKDVANQAKHGVSLSVAGELSWEALVWIDDRARSENRILYYVASVDRGEVRRVISLRRANRREVTWQIYPVL